MTTLPTLSRAGRAVAYVATYRTRGDVVRISFADLPEAQVEVPGNSNLGLAARDLLDGELGRLVVNRQPIPAPTGPARRFASSDHREQMIVPDQPVALKALLWDAMHAGGVSISALARHLDVDEKEVRRLLEPGTMQRRLPEAVEAVLGVQPAITVINGSLPARITGPAGHVPQNAAQDLRPAFQVPLAQRMEESD